MNWFTYSIFSVFALALAELAQQHLLNEEKFDEVSSAVFTNAIQAFLVLVIILLFPSIPSSGFFSIFRADLLPYTLTMGVISAFGTVFYLKGLNVSNISFSGILFSLSIIVSTTLGILFFKESTSLLKFLGLFLILGSVVSVNINNVHLEKNHVFALLGGFLFGVVYVFDKKIVMQTHPLIYLFWAFALVCVINLLKSYKQVYLSLRKIKLQDLYPIFLSGVGYSLYNFSTFSAYLAGGEVGKIDAINNSQVFIIIAFEYFVLKQKGGVVRKILTTVIATIGVYLLGVYQ